MLDDVFHGGKEATETVDNDFVDEVGAAAIEKDGEFVYKVAKYFSDQLGLEGWGHF